jgi:hypothetical protein
MSTESVLGKEAYLAARRIEVVVADAFQHSLHWGMCYKTTDGKTGCFVSNSRCLPFWAKIRAFPPSRSPWS